MEIKIRQENEKDYAEVYELIKKAFGVAEHADGDEQDLVERLRKGKSFVPELSLVAEIDGKIVGQILFTKANVNDKVLLVLAPLSILPEYQHQGIGRKLIDFGHEKARAIGFAGSLSLGDPKVYMGSGYIPASKWKIVAPFEIPDEYFLAVELAPGALSEFAGIVTYAKEFNIA